MTLTHKQIERALSVLLDHLSNPTHEHALEHLDELCAAKAVLSGIRNGSLLVIAAPEEKAKS
jgi:hypothetical protein